MRLHARCEAQTGSDHGACSGHDNEEACERDDDDGFGGECQWAEQDSVTRAEAEWDVFNRNDVAVLEIYPRLKTCPEEGGNPIRGYIVEIHGSRAVLLSSFTKSWFFSRSPPVGGDSTK